MQGMGVSRKIAEEIPHPLPQMEFKSICSLNDQIFFSKEIPTSRNLGFFFLKSQLMYCEGAKSNHSLSPNQPDWCNPCRAPQSCGCFQHTLSCALQHKAALSWSSSSASLQELMIGGGGSQESDIFIVLYWYEVIRSLYNIMAVKMFTQ